MKRTYSQKDRPLQMVPEWTAEGKPQWRKLTTKEKQQETARQWELVRQERDRLLQESDITQLPDSPYGKEPWAAYRNELRNLPQTQTDPFAIQWPMPPSASAAERARNALGQFVGDNPATPDVNEAWG